MDGLIDWLIEWIFAPFTQHAKANLHSTTPSRALAMAGFDPEEDGLPNQ